MTSHTYDIVLTGTGFTRNRPKRSFRGTRLLAAAGPQRIASTSARITALRRIGLLINVIHERRAVTGYVDFTRLSTW
jgi:hypothetical protein